jgi:hypothetical protein
MREYRVAQQVNRSINHFIGKSGKNPALRRQNYSLGTCTPIITLRFSGNIQENSPLETGPTNKSINSGKISRLAKVIIQPVYG